MLTTFEVELQQQYTNFKNNLQQLADRIGNVEQETEEHKYVDIIVFAESVSLPNIQCDYVFPLISTANSRLTVVLYSRLVLETLKPLPGVRKCFRMINGVLVERTVKDVLPALQINADGLKRVLDELVKQYKRQQEDMEKWKVRCYHGLASISQFTFAEPGCRDVFLGYLLTFFVCPEKEQRSSCATVVLQPSLCLSPQSSSCRSWHTDVQALNLDGRLSSQERVQLPQRSVQKVRDSRESGQIP